MYKWYKRMVYTHSDLLARFCKVKFSKAKKIHPVFFFFLLLFFYFQAELIYGDQEPLWLLNVIEDDCHVLGVHIRLSTRCKICFTLGLFANYFSLKSLSLSLKRHMNVL